jgi:hypothetical protein
LNVVSIVVLALIFSAALGIGMNAMSSSNMLTSNSAMQQIVSAFGQNGGCTVGPANSLNCTNTSANNPFNTSPNVLTFGYWAFGLFTTLTMIYQGVNTMGAILGAWIPADLVSLIMIGVGFLVAMWIYTTITGRYNQEVD